jgi:hypothetical protein
MAPRLGGRKIPGRRYVSGQLHAHLVAIERLSQLGENGAATDDHVRKSRLLDARHAVEFTGRLLADYIRSHGHGDPPRLVINGYQIKLSDDGRNVVLKTPRDASLRARNSPLSTSK